MTATGLVHVYYGDGKGKTTAALGLSLRAYGQGRQVVIVQFLKNTFSGELAAFEKLPGIRVLRGQSGKGFASRMTDDQKSETRQIHDANLKEAIFLSENGRCDLLVLDEALDACQLAMLDEEAVAGLLSNKPAHLEIVITGHRPIDWILERADYVTEMVKRKHPYDLGVKARKGIEY